MLDPTGSGRGAIVSYNTEFIMFKVPWVVLLGFIQVSLAHKSHAFLLAALFTTMTRIHI